MLEKTRLENSRYHFHSGKIRGLISSIEEQGHEIGLHGTLESSQDPEAMLGGLKRLNAVTRHPVSGIRQHYLKYSNPQSTRIHEKAGFSYDATLGFAEQAGFRNSFAHPFRLYDFERERPFSVWQIPLLAMDVSLMAYMGIPMEKIPAAIDPLLAEVKKFHGIFSLLWHNCNLDEEEFPGINRTYIQLLESILDSGFIPANGRDVLEPFKSSGV